MTTLRKDLRKDLEKSIIKARSAAEKAATSALEALAVGEAKPFDHMDARTRALRNRLRVRGRAVGDKLDKSGRQDISHLAELVGYEHWHRMIFARFLAENGLLLEPEHQVALSLDDVEELAREEGVELWDLAGGYAQRMLPGVFRNDDAALEVTLAREDRAKLEKLLAALDPAVFIADDSLGWTYQFWQIKRKEQVNASGEKIGADELSPVTQLFTEDYMVEFLLHNTLGAWWAGKLGPIQAANEEEARAMAALPSQSGGEGISITWTYLRFIQDEETQTWKPAAGTFEGWPTAAKDITFLDPCMGSGHFPVFALPILARLRMEEENLSATEAVHAVLRDNIHGLELDPRCCQIGAFNLALTAWKLAGHQPLPALHIACCGLAPQAKLADWVALAGDSDKLQRGMERLYKLFEQAPVLGSLINPRLDGGDLLEADFHELQPLLEQAMAQEAGDEAAHEMAVTAQGLAKAAEMLSSQFTLVSTNVPFLGYREMGASLVDHVTNAFPDEKGDLGYCLWRRFQSLLQPHGATALVSLQHWLSLKSYTRMRYGILRHFKVEAVAHLGTGAFETISGEKVNVTLTTCRHAKPSEGDVIALIDAASASDPVGKAKLLLSGSIKCTDQERQYANPDHRISFGELTNLPRLDKYADCLAGIMNGDSPKFIRLHWEFPKKSDQWVYLQGTVTSGIRIGGLESIIYFDEKNGHLREERSIRRVKLHNADERGNAVWGRPGVAISQMSSLPASRYFGNKYDSNIATIVPRSVEHLLPIWTFCSSVEFHNSVRAIDRKLNVTNATFGKVPFDLAHWQEVAAEKYPDGLPKPHSDDPTQWLFNGHPAGSEQPLQVAVARLLGYRWPRQTGSSFPDCPALEPDGLEAFADEDGIVCLTPLRGEAKATERLSKLLDEAFSKSGWNARQLLTDIDSKKTKLEDWLRDEFFEQHCKLFHNRPFIWHIWDGRPDGFHALVNYHQLAAPNGVGHKLLETLTFSYLGDWIRRQQDDTDQGVPGAEERLLAAEFLQKELKNILAGEPPYDIFVRWKPLHQQAIGWHPDLNDGVRLNIRPFMMAKDVKPTRGKNKGPGILRSKLNVKWTKDRGKEPERDKSDFPWFWTWDEETQDFQGGEEHDGNRWNDLHYTTAAKQKAKK